MKYFFFSLLVTLFCFTSEAQTWNELNDKVVEMYNIGQYEKGIPMAIHSMEIAEEKYGDTHPYYITSLGNLALLYETTLQYEKAITLYSKACDIQKKLTGNKSTKYAAAISRLGEVYYAQGVYEKAEPIFIETIAVYELIGEKNTDYANSLNDLALLYMDIGQYEKSELLYLRANEMRKDILGENNRDYPTGLDNLANLYLLMGKNEKALSLYTRSKEIRKIVLGENDPYYATSLNNLAELYRTTGDYKNAEPLYIQSMQIRKKALGEYHPYYANSLNNLALFYHTLGYDEKAEPLYLQAKDIIEKTLGKYHPYYYNTLNNLAFLYFDLGNFEKAEPLIVEATQIKIQDLKNTFTILSEKEKANYINKNTMLVTNDNSFLFNYKKSSPALVINNFNLQVFIKSLSLAAARSMISSVMGSTDPLLRQRFDEWKKNKIMLAKQYSLLPANRMAGIDRIEAKTEALEKELTRTSAAFRNGQGNLGIDMKSIQRKLQDNEAAIEFVRFRLFNKKVTDSVIYAAYILTKNAAMPVFVPLCEEKQLQQLFSSKGANSNSLVTSIYRGAGEENDNISVTKGDNLYRLIWQPLEPYLKGIKKIVYSPAGKLYTVAFNALPVGEGKILMDKYELQQYTSTRQVALRNDADKGRPKNILLFGDAQFSKKSTGITAVSTTNVWASLPGTADEVKKISQIFSQHHISEKSLLKLQASEENLKKLSGNSPQVIHLATHGFFLPEPVMNTGKMPSETFAQAQDPLLRSGLLLAGANDAWRGKVPSGGDEDGIATAYEISQLDLGRTKLVVLSACETALGDIQGSEGVFGLQRAFKMAGVDKMIVSLWQVPDKETGELMVSFYNNWLGGDTIGNAFYKAQSAMRKKYTPFYWAAFVLIE